MGRLLKYIAEETQGACFTSFKFCYDTWLRQCATQSHPWFVVTHWFSTCAMWWRRNVMKSGRIGGGLADCLFVCQPFVFRKTGCLFVASQKLQNISFFRTSRGDCGEKRPGAHHCLVCSGPFLLQIPRVCQQDASFYPVSQRTAKSRFLKGVSGGKIRLSIRILA